MASRLWEKQGELKWGSISAWCFWDAESSTSTTNLDLTELHESQIDSFIRQVRKCT